MARHAVAVTAARGCPGGADERRAAVAGFPVAGWPGLRDRLAAGGGTGAGGGGWAAREPRRGTSRDAATGSAAVGAHRADMVLTDATTGVAAALASTGEQKALLVGSFYVTPR